MFRLALGFLALLGLAACDSQFKDLEEVPPPLGRFLLGHNIVVVDHPQTLPISRKASDEEWKEALTQAIDERFRRYDGDKYYHLATRVEGYSLAPPGIPVIAAPKSTLIITVSVWDDEKGTVLNEEPKQFTVFENFGAASIVGSGLTHTREEQIQNLARNAARMVQNWLLEHPEWFGDASQMDPATTSAGFPASKIPRSALTGAGTAQTGTTGGAEGGSGITTKTLP